MKCIVVIATTVASCLASAPRAAAQAEVPRVARVGMLSDLEKFGNPVSAPPPDWLASFRAGLRDSGYEEGKNIRFEFRNGDRDPEKLAKFAAELAAMKVDVIVASSSTAAKAAKAATHVIPIVFWGAEPISSGLVANLDHPGENLTGVTANEEQQTEFLAMLKEVVPDLKRVAILFNRSYAPVPGLLKNAESGARALGLSTQLVEVAAPSDLPGAFEAMKREGSRAVLVLNHGMFLRERTKLAALAIENGIAVSTPYLSNGEAGALIAHEADFDRVWRLNASHVDKILKGANPGDLPVERLATFRYSINLKTALGFTRLVTTVARFRHTSEAEGLLRHIGAISELVGMRYWSTTHKQWQTLILDAHALTDLQPAQRREDFTPDEMKEGKVLYFEQADNLSGKAIYRMHIAEASRDRLVVDVENVSAMRYLLIPILHAGEMQSIYFLDRESDNVWRYYSIVRVGKNANKLIAGNESSAVNRAVAFYRHMVGIPTDLEPPVAR